MNMNQEQLNRAKSSEGQGIENSAYLKFKTLIYNQDKPLSQDTLLLGIKCYYDHAAGERCWSTIKKDIQSLRDEDLRELLLKLATETINRDMIDYILKGKRGDHALRMHDILKS
jgi:hypothetical protein